MLSDLPGSATAMLGDREELSYMEVARALHFQDYYHVQMGRYFCYVSLAEAES